LSSLEPTYGRTSVARGLAVGARIAAPWRDWLVGLSLGGLALLIYLPDAFRAGWYYDDWSIYSEQRDASGSFFHHVHACTANIQGGRTLACLYHAAEYAALGSHRSAYHLVALGFLIVIALLAYQILVRCRLPWQWAALTAGLLVISPASDSTRLWPVAAIGLAVVAMQMTGTLIALVALRHAPGRRTTALHVIAGALSLLAMATYEIAIPLVLLNVFAYLAVTSRRAALRRGAVDLGLVIVFLIYRTIIRPVSSASGLQVHRDLSATIDRARTLLKGAWQTWHALYIPGSLGWFVIGAVSAGAVTLAAVDATSRRRLFPWAALLLAATVTAAICSLVFLTANDLYLLSVSGTFNRLNLPGTFAYAAAFVGLVGLGYEVTVRIGLPRQLALLMVIVGVAATAVHQLGVSSDHKRAWEASTQEQNQALSGIRVAVASLPSRSRILGFDTPILEVGYVPVFAATWDLKGAIDYTTRLRPTFAVPNIVGLTCGQGGLVLNGAEVAPYAIPGQPLYAVSPRRREALRITSQQSCQAITARWGQSPFWGKTVPGGV
jgi:hypothetical protein